MITIDKAIAIDFTKKSTFIADNIRLKSVLSLNVKCIATGSDFNTIHGIINTLAGSSFGNTIPDFRQEISINGQSFGKGYVQSISADPEGPDAQFKYYNINFIIDYEGFLNKVFAAIVLADAKVIESISENLSFSQDKNTKTFSHQIDIQVNPDAKADGLNKCKTIQTAIRDDILNIEQLIKIANITYDFTRDVGTFPTIEYDSVSCKYTYTESWEKRDQYSPATTYPTTVLTTRTIKRELKEDGIINITISLEGISNENPLNYETVKTFIDGEAATNLYTTANEFYTKFKPAESTGTLKEIALVKNYTTSKNEGKYGITIVYTDDINVYKTEEVMLEITHSRVFEELETIISEEGTIYSLKPYLITHKEIDGSSDQRYQAALTRFKMEKPLIKERSILFKKDLVLPDSFKIIYYSNSHSYNEGIIKYTYKYSNNPSLKYIDENDTSTVFRKEVEEKQFQPTADRIKFATTFTEIGADKFQISQESVSKNFEDISSKKIYNISSTTKFKDALLLLYDNLLFVDTSNSYVENVEITYSSENRELTSSISAKKVVPAT
jgi:hypothetical protein